MAAPFEWVLERHMFKFGDDASSTASRGNSDSFDNALGDYAVGYAGQIERYAVFIRAVRLDRLASYTMPGLLEVAPG